VHGLSEMHPCPPRGMVMVSDGAVLLNARRPYSDRWLAPGVAADADVESEMLDGS
jgi:hypothetical protein